jgi:hypothetical protein
LIRLPFSIFFLLNLVPNLDVRLEEHQWTCIALRKHSQTKCWYLLMVVFQTFWYILYAVLFRQSHPSCQYFNIFQYVVLYISNLPRMLSVLETSVESMLTMHQCIANKMFSRGRKAVTQTSAWDQRPSVKGGQPRSCFGWKRTNHFFSQRFVTRVDRYFELHISGSLCNVKTAAYKFTFNPLQTRTNFWRCLKNCLNVV